MRLCKSSSYECFDHDSLSIFAVLHARSDQVCSKWWKFFWKGVAFCLCYGPYLNNCSLFKPASSSSIDLDGCKCFSRYDFSCLPQNILTLSSSKQKVQEGRYRKLHICWCKDNGLAHRITSSSREIPHTTVCINHNALLLLWCGIHSRSWIDHLVDYRQLYQCLNDRKNSKVGNASKRYVNE